MRILLPALLLAAACGSGLVDHTGAQLLPDGNGLCPAGRRACGGTCVVEDVNNCGGCGRTCPAVANASNSCVAGNCQLTCNPGFFDRCADGCCAAVSLAAGGDTSCAVLPGGLVRCWGSNDSGQLGSPAGPLSQFSAKPVTVPGLEAAASVAMGEHHACAVLAAGAVACWGANQSGQAIMPGIAGVRSLALGGRHSCARTDTAVVCWGANDFGQLGGGPISAQRGPGAVVGLPAGVISIAAGRDFSCAVASGRLFCWGRNDSGQLGDPPISSSYASPVEVREVSNALVVGAGASHACGIGSGFWCWGANSFGQVGNGNLDEPIASPAGVNLQLPSLVGGGSSHTCAVSNGALFCWGSNEFGQLGLGVPTLPQRRPAAVPSLTAVQRLALGAMHSCAQRTDGTVVCWGNNGSGQIGARQGGAFFSPRPID